jgi:hypothetical protein
MCIKETFGAKQPFSNKIQVFLSEFQLQVNPAV